jgi:hypothetical protein
MRPPWEDHNSILAAAFRAAFDRANAVAAGAEKLVTVDRESRGAMLLGTDIDVGELQEYVNGLAHVYWQLAVEAVDGQRNERAFGYAPTVDDPLLRAAFIRVMRGAFVQAILIGDYHGRAWTAQNHPSRPTTGPEDASPVDTARVPFDDPGEGEREALRTDAVQLVLDLEADRLDRLAPVLDTLGLRAIANNIRLAAIALRHQLENA